MGINRYNPGGWIGALEEEGTESREKKLKLPRQEVTLSACGTLYMEGVRQGNVYSEQMSNRNGS